MTPMNEREAIVAWLSRMDDVYAADFLACPWWRFVRRAKLIGRATAIRTAMHFIAIGDHLKGQTDDR